MTPPPKLFQALLRPSILQILRATGFHSTRPAVLDSLAELAGAYLHILCRATAAHADSHRRLHAVFEDDGTAWAVDDGGGGGSGAPSIVDVRMALQDVGALVPERAVQDQALLWPAGKTTSGKRNDEGGEEFAFKTEDGYGMDHHDGHDRLSADDDDEAVWLRNEDLRGVHEFIAWFAGPRMRELQALTVVDGESEPTDYLNGEDSKYHGTMLGKGNDAGEILIEGGDVSSVQAWMDRMHKQALLDDVCLHVNGTTHASDSGDDESRPPSSGLSSLGDRIDDDDGGEMDLSMDMS